MWVLGPELQSPALAGLAAAWAVSTTSVAIMSGARAASLKAFIWAFGAGAALRITVLAALVLLTASRGPRAQSAAAVPYILAAVLLLAVESRRLRSSHGV